MAEQKPARVTALIATYNYGKYLADAIDGVKAQTYPCSICVIDDGSTDNSWEIIHNKLFKNVPHEKKTVNGQTVKIATGILAIRLEKNVGPSEARNIGIEATIESTDAYLIVDADDKPYPEKVQKLLNVMLGCYQQIGVVYADYDVLNTETGIKSIEFKEPFDKHRLLQECIVHSNALISSLALKTVKDQFGYYDVNMRTCEDYDLWIRISERFIIFHVAEPLTLVRVTPDNSTATVKKEIWNQNWQRIRQKLQARHG